MITQDEVKHFFDYLDGQLYWRISPSRRVRLGALAGTAANTGYVKIKLKHKFYSAHRVIFLWHHGWLPAEIDHKDNNRSNNKIENLRAATRSQNRRNSPVQKNNALGVKNVSWNKQRQTWRVRVRYDGGVFCKDVTDFELAVLIAEEVRAKYHGDFARN
jgi:hypothetical protein